MKRYLLLLFVFAAFAVNAQTRNDDGTPGPDYWQNFSDYKINAFFDPKNGALKGTESIVYKNNSPEQLDIIVFNVYLNLYKKGNKNVKVDLANSDLGDGVKFNYVKIGKKNQEYTVDGTKMIVKLRRPLKPGKSLIFNISWEEKLPENPSVRIGKYHNDSWFVGYWYPQIAVYDDVDGWDTIQHSGIEEHYFEFANYDVNITLPDGYYVLGSGVLQNRSEIFNEATETKFLEADNSDKSVKIISGDNCLKNDTTTFRFKSDTIGDFAFCAVKNFELDGCTFTMKNSQKVNFYVVTPQTKRFNYFSNYANKIRDLIEYFSEIEPGVSYPYPQVTVFLRSECYGSMEFPMIVNVLADHDVNVATRHEIAHTYAPFLVGVNQAKDGWIDEGFAMRLPYYYFNDVSADFESDVNEVSILNFSSRFDVSCLVNHLDYSHSSMNTPTFQLTENELFFNSYVKSLCMWYYLDHMIGRDTVTNAFMTLFSNWRNKHVKTDDIINTFNTVSGRNLNWYFRDWLLFSEPADLKIKKVGRDNFGYYVLVSNNSKIPLPVRVSIYNPEKTYNYVKALKKADIWESGYDDKKIYIDFDYVTFPCIITLYSDVLPNVVGKGLTVKLDSLDDIINDL